MEKEYDLLDNVVKLHYYLVRLHDRAIDFAKKDKDFLRKEKDLVNSLLLHTQRELSKCEIKWGEILPSKLAPRRDDIEFLFKQYKIPRDISFYDNLSAETNKALRKLEREGAIEIQGKSTIVALQCSIMKKFMSYIYEAAGLPEAEAHEKQKEENNNPLPVEEQKDETQENNVERYPKELLNLFHGHVELLDKLVTMANREIASQIKKWANEKDKYGKPLIDNPKNNLRAEYARRLHEAGLISCKPDTFKRSL